MTAFREFTYTDAGAPALSGQAGSLTALLDAVLVDGYGTGPSAKAPAGWSRIYSATNKRVYRGDVISGTGYLLRVDDTAAIGNARHAWLRGYESMSAIDTGTNLVPTVAQVTDGALWQKSITADATARPWQIFANDKNAYVFLDCGGLGLGLAAPFAFGDLISHMPGDNHHFWLACNTLTSYAGATGNYHGTMFKGNTLASAVATPSLGQGAVGYIGRAYSGAPGSVLLGHVNEDFLGAACSGRSLIAYPDPVSGGLLWGPAHMREASNVIRGKLPGIIVPLHNIPLPDQTKIIGLVGSDGIDAMVKSFRANNLSNSTYDGQVLIDLTTEY